MQCPNCGQANREQANYCRFCGTHFALACPRCRTVLPEDALFCDNCGFQLSETASVPFVPPAALAQPRPAQPVAARQPTLPTAPETSAVELQRFMPEELARKVKAATATGETVGERRIVTMLFCD